MKIFTLIIALAWALTIFVTIYFKVNFLGLDSNSWGLIFSAIYAICASILYFYGSKKSKNSSIKQKASAKDNSSVIQVGRDYTSGKK